MDNNIQKDLKSSSRKKSKEIQKRKKQVKIKMINMIKKKMKRQMKVSNQYSTIEYQFSKSY